MGQQTRGQDTSHYRFSLKKIAMKSFLVIATLVCFGAAFKIDDIAVLPHLKVVNEAMQTVQRQARQEASPEEQARVLFSFGDSDRNNKISVSEMANFLSAAAGLSQAQARATAQTFVQFGDRNGDGELDRAEYIAVARIAG